MCIFANFGEVDNEPNIYKYRLCSLQGRFFFSEKRGGTDTNSKEAQNQSYTSLRCPMRTIYTNKISSWISYIIR